MNLEHIAFTTTDLETQEGYYIDNSPNASNRILKLYKGVNYNARHQVGYLMSYFPISVLNKMKLMLL